MLILGLTGGIASGKSVVSKHFRDKGIPVIDADALSHEVTQKGGEGALLIENTFGKKFFYDGELDRKMLAQEIFCSPEKTKQLNELLHPVIKKEIEKYINIYEKENRPLTVVEAPLLIESGMHTMCDKLLLITCEKQIRIKRAMERSGISQQEVCARIARQMSDENKKPYADFIIDNSGRLEDTLMQADCILNTLSEKMED